MEERKEESLPCRFGDFYLFDLIGKGGMADIFLAKTFTSLGHERLCVIKRIRPHLSRNRDFAEMFIQEAKLSAKLRNANVVQIFDLGEAQDQLYIAMEYVEGFDLNELLGLCTRAGLAIPAEFVFFILREAIRALDYAHRSVDENGRPIGLIHRDVSPSNILISTEGEVRLCDFGIARATLLDVHPGATPDEAIKGKFAYMSPEQVRGEEADQRSDLFAAGILLWELLAGRRLYKRPSVDETYRLALEAKIPELENRGIPEFDRIRAIVRKALSHDPRKRFASAAEFLHAMDDYIHVARLLPSQIRFAQFLKENFGEDLIARRRERERALSVVLPSIESFDDKERRSDEIIPPIGRGLRYYLGVGAVLLLTIAVLSLIIAYCR